MTAAEDARQTWRTPAWLLDALVGGGWAGLWDVDAYAAEDGSDAVTWRDDDRWAGPRREQLLGRAWEGRSCEIVNKPYCSAARPIDWTSAEISGLRIFANPPFRLWSVAGFGALHGMRRPDGPAEVTLVGLDDRSTELGRALHRAEHACEAGDVHATRVSIVGRWGFDPPPGVEPTQADRAHGVWVLRRVVVPPRRTGRRTAAVRE